MGRTVEIRRRCQPAGPAGNREQARRRQGKTFLLRALAEATGAFYFAAAEATAADSLREFGAALATQAGARAPYALTGWDDAFRVLAETVPGGLAIIDEFPYLIRADPALPSLVQRLIDQRAWGEQAQGTRLLLCGSAMSVMGGLLAGAAPLRGRASLELLVQPFGYRTAAEFWQISDPELAVLVHCIVGGTPAYRHEFVAEDIPASLADFDDWVARTVLNPAVPLFREARYLLAEETGIREPALYNSVLAAIAAGNTSRGGIANFVGRKSTELVHPLNVLEDSGLITGRPIPSTGAGRHSGSPNRSSSSTKPSCGTHGPRWSSVRPQPYGAVSRPPSCPRWSARTSRSCAGSGPRMRARRPSETCRGEVSAGTVTDPGGRAQIEVDVAVLGPGVPGEPRRILSLGEAKWGETMDSRHLDRLRRARDLLSVKGFQTAGTVLPAIAVPGSARA